MPSISYLQWRTIRATALDEIAQAHTIVGGTGRGRRYATQQINHAYAVLLASQFQGFCRDLHSESVGHLLTIVPGAFRPVMQAEFSRGRHLDRGNASPSSLGVDFGRLGVDLWIEMSRLNPRNSARQALLAELNTWRNAIAHQDFDARKLGGTVVLRLNRVRLWRNACSHLARALDEVLRIRLQSLTGASPW